jgi:hypothetical protein
MYYAFWTGLMVFLLRKFPAIQDFFPIGGIGALVDVGNGGFEPIYSSAEETILAPAAAFRLAFASLGAGILIIPVSWVYFITSRSKDVDQSFVQTIIIMPIVVTGISMIVMNSLALAFRAISIGLGSGIGALGVAMVISMAFVYSNMIIWKLEYGKTLSGTFFSMLTRRDRAEDDY